MVPPDLDDFRFVAGIGGKAPARDANDDEGQPEKQETEERGKPGWIDAPHNSHRLPEHRTGNHGQNREDIKQEGGF